METLKPSIAIARLGGGGTGRGYHLIKDSCGNIETCHSQVSGLGWGWGGVYHLIDKSCGNIETVHDTLWGWGWPGGVGGPHLSQNGYGNAETFHNEALGVVVGIT